MANNDREGKKEKHAQILIFNNILLNSKRIRKIVSYEKEKIERERIKRNN